MRGSSLAETQTFAGPTASKPSPSVEKKMNSMARAAGVTPKKVMSFEVHRPAAAKSLMKGMPKATQPSVTKPVRYHVMFGTKKKKDVDLARGVAIVAKSEDGTIVQAQELYLKV
jgi:hypothetical protein